MIFLQRNKKMTSKVKRIIYGSKGIQKNLTRPGEQAKDLM